MDRIKLAFTRGYQSGRFWRRYQTTIHGSDLTNLNPYITYWPGVQCHVAWKMGFYTAFNNVGKAPARDWRSTRSLYAI